MCNFRTHSEEALHSLLLLWLCGEQDADTNSETGFLSFCDFGDFAGDDFNHDLVDIWSFAKHVGCVLHERSGDGAGEVSAAPFLMRECIEDGKLFGFGVNVFRGVPLEGVRLVEDKSVASDEELTDGVAFAVLGNERNEAAVSACCIER